MPILLSYGEDRAKAIAELVEAYEEVVFNPQNFQSNVQLVRGRVQALLGADACSNWPWPHAACMDAT